MAYFNNYESARMANKQKVPPKLLYTRACKYSKFKLLRVAYKSKFFLDVSPPNQYKCSSKGGLNGTSDIFLFSLGVTPSSKLPSCP